jgi:predicted XRE-type DNA-binding protein
MKKRNIEKFECVWAALADTPFEAASLRTRAELTQKICAIIQMNKWTQVEAATRCGVTQPRINELIRGRVSHFSLDALVNIATALGQRVELESQAA